MKIGELARQSGMAASTIRFYEAKGLLKIGNRQSNGYRDYPSEALTVLRIIGDAQQAGFSLDEIKRILPDDASSWKHGELVAAIKRKIADIEAMQAQLKRNKAELQDVLRMIESKPEGMDCKENAQRVVDSRKA